MTNTSNQQSAIATAALVGMAFTFWLGNKIDKSVRQKRITAAASISTKSVDQKPSNTEDAQPSEDRKVVEKGRQAKATRSTSHVNPNSYTKDIEEDETSIVSSAASVKSTATSSTNSCKKSAIQPRRPVVAHKKNVNPSDGEEDGASIVSSAISVKSATTSSTKTSAKNNARRPFVARKTHINPIPPPHPIRTATALPLSPLTNSSTNIIHNAPASKRASKKKQPRVRDSLLPAEIRQRLKANIAPTVMRGAEKTMENFQPSAIHKPSIHKVKASSSSRKKVRVRESLLPASIRDNLKKTSWKETKEEPSQLESPTASRALPLSSQGGSLNPKTTARRSLPVPTQPSTQYKLRTPKKLSPTRRGVYENGARKKRTIVKVRQSLLPQELRGTLQ